MKNLSTLLRIAVLPLALCLCQCTSAPKLTQRESTAPGSLAVSRKAGANSDKDSRKEPAAVAAASAQADDLDEYAVTEISDPFEGMNRGFFWFNDKLYLVIFRPISKGYEKVIPKPLRKGINNAYENVKFPVRLVNCALQGKFKRAGLHTEKFLVNTIAGLGGLIRVSDKIPVLADLPEEDFGKTFAKWGMGHGPYIVIPFLGPSSLRDGVGLIGDYAANPVNWGIFMGGDHDWTMIPPAGNTLRALPAQLSTYDQAKSDAIDPYTAIRSAYVQYRAEAVKK